MSVATHAPEGPRAGTARRTRLTPRAAALAVILTVLLFYPIVPLRTYVEQRNRLTELEQQTAALKQQNARLVHQIAQLGDPGYLERIARECLGMVRAGEIGFVVVPGTGTMRPPVC